MNVLEVIKKRRSIRSYINQPIEPYKIELIIQAGVWSPSGKNRQPWKYKVITDTALIYNISKLTLYSRWMKNAACFIVVFLDKNYSYNYIKDVQSCGATMQNMMLVACDLGVGSCWIGEVMEKGECIKQLLNITQDSLELMGIIVLGYEEGIVNNPGRREIQSFLL